MRGIAFLQWGPPSCSFIPARKKLKVRAPGLLPSGPSLPPFLKPKDLVMAEDWVQVGYVILSSSDLNVAIREIRELYGFVYSASIGFYNSSSKKCRIRSEHLWLSERLRKWMTLRTIDAVIWVDFEKNSMSRQKWPETKPHPWVSFTRAHIQIQSESSHSDRARLIASLFRSHQSSVGDQGRLLLSGQLRKRRTLRDEGDSPSLSPSTPPPPPLPESKSLKSAEVLKKSKLIAKEVNEKERKTDRYLKKWRQGGAGWRRLKKMMSDSRGFTAEPRSRSHPLKPPVLLFVPVTRRKTVSLPSSSPPSPSSPLSPRAFFQPSSASKVQPLERSSPSPPSPLRIPLLPRNSRVKRGSVVPLSSVLPSAPSSAVEAAVASKGGVVVKRGVQLERLCVGAPAEGGGGEERLYLSDWRSSCFAGEK